jgi:hypothetical protein
MVDARLHKADVVTHDEEDVGLAGWRLRVCGQACRRSAEEQSNYTAASSDRAHGLFSYVKLPSSGENYRVLVRASSESFRQTGKAIVDHRRALCNFDVLSPGDIDRGAAHSDLII